MTDRIKERKSLIEKLSPERHRGMSPKMASLVGCILGHKFTDPQLAELSASRDGFLLGRTEGDLGFNEFIGSMVDFERNWTNLLNCAGLTVEEYAGAEALKMAVIQSH